MRKQLLTIGAVLLVAVTAWVIVWASPARQAKFVSPKCNKTCETKSQPIPQTGFFIFDSFSENL
jgi:hypothetical protein